MERPSAVLLQHTTGPAHGCVSTRRESLGMLPQKAFVTSHFFPGKLPDFFALITHLICSPLFPSMRGQESVIWEDSGANHTNQKKQLYFFEFFKLYFINYAIIVVPFFPLLSPFTSAPYSLRQSPHHCSCPWVICVSSLAAPYPILYCTSPWTWTMVGGLPEGVGGTCERG